MKIDLIITELAVGGAERCLTELASGLANRGHQVRVLTLGPPPKPPQDLLWRRLLREKIPVWSAETTTLTLAPLALNRLQRMLARQQPDLCQSFLFHANVLGTLAARMARVPICVAGMRVAQPRRFRLWLEKQALRRCDAVVCVSESVADFARRHFAGIEPPLYVIPNGVDTGRFASTPPARWGQYGIPSQTQVIVFVGRLAPQKGLERLFAAAGQLLARDRNRWLVLIGDGPLRPWCQQQCDLLPQRRALLLPWQADVAPYIKAATLIMLTSDYEGMPNVILEAMAAGRAVVSTKVEGVSELLGSGAEGQIVDHDCDSVVQATEALLSDPNRTESVGVANAIRAESEFGIPRMIDRYERLYHELHAAGYSPTSP